MLRPEEYIVLDRARLTERQTRDLPMGRRKRLGEQKPKVKDRGPGGLRAEDFLVPE